jgi:hypothetical protein
VNAYVKKDMDQHVVIVAYLDFSTIQNVFLAIVLQSVLFHTFVISMENVHAYKILLENVVNNVWLDFMTIQNVFHVIVTPMDQSESAVITKDNVTVIQTLMEKHAIHARKITTTIHCVKVVTVIQVEL